MSFSEIFKIAGLVCIFFILAGTVLGVIDWSGK